MIDSMNNFDLTFEFLELLSGKYDLEYDLA